MKICDAFPWIHVSPKCQLFRKKNNSPILCFVTVHFSYNPMGFRMVYFSLKPLKKSLCNMKYLWQRKATINSTKGILSYNLWRVCHAKAQLNRPSGPLLLFVWICLLHERTAPQLSADTWWHSDVLNPDWCVEEMWHESWPLWEEHRRAQTKTEVHKSLLE